MMRPDLYKILMERPRLGYGTSATTLKAMRNAYRGAKHFKLDAFGDVCDMYCSQKMPMRCRGLRHQIKVFNENLHPLERYLLAQVGRPWNDVYSEIAQNLKTSSTTQQHLRMHALWTVHTNVKMHTDGRMLDITGFQYYCDYLNHLYVHPITGILSVGTFDYDQ
jgi:hypothetical protein